MSLIGSVTQWIDGLRQGDDLAAQQIWQTFHEQLLQSARCRLASAKKRVADEEDVVISAFDSFFRGAKQGRFPQLDDREDLWKVLLMLTARKASNQVTAQDRIKRGGGKVRGDSVLRPDDGRPAEHGAFADQGPSPEFCAAIAEQFQRLLDSLKDPSLRQVALMKMEGYANGEIAEKLGCQLRTVQRKIRIIREIWEIEGKIDAP